MHELSLAQALLDQVLELARQHGAERVLRVEVVVGPRAGVVIDSFRFGFEALRLDHASTRKTCLEITVPPLVFRCPSCGREFRPANSQHGKRAIPASHPCPHCGHDQCLGEGGDELILKQVEME